MATASSCPNARKALSYASATKNDFVMIDDPAGRGELNSARVRELAGPTGVDGVIRAIRTRCLGAPASQGLDTVPEWFMDYRNADGTIAQMCGNGVRAYAAFLADRGYVEDRVFDVMTRAGVRTVEILEEGPQWQVRVGMGAAELEGVTRIVRVADRFLEGTDVNVGNPHTVVELPENLSLDELDLTERPELEPEPEDGTNIEFAEIRGDRHVAMRVFERGVGETLSCGTGATAVVAALAEARGDDTREPWRVDVRGGRLEIGWDPYGRMTLTGPAELGELTCGGPARERGK